MQIKSITDKSFSETAQIVDYLCGEFVQSGYFLIFCANIFMVVKVRWEDIINCFTI